MISKFCLQEGPSLNSNHPCNCYNEQSQFTSLRKLEVLGCFEFKLQPFTHDTRTGFTSPGDCVFSMGLFQPELHARASRLLVTMSATRFFLISTDDRTLTMCQGGNWTYEPSARRTLTRWELNPQPSLNGVKCECPLYQ